MKRSPIKRKPAKKKIKPQTLKNKATVLHSKIIRAKGRCERCGATQTLQTAHIISRRYSNTRTDIDNAWCLCAKCHMFLTQHPHAHMQYVAETIGLDKHAQLWEKAQSTQKVDWVQQLQFLKAYASLHGVE